MSGASSDAISDSRASCRDGATPSVAPGPWRRTGSTPPKLTSAASDGFWAAPRSVTGRGDLPGASRARWASVPALRTRFGGAVSAFGVDGRAPGLNQALWG